MKPWMALLLSLATATFGATLGYGFSQTRLGTIVIEVSTKQSELTRRMDSFEKESRAHMTEAIDLFKEQMRLQQEFISVIKVQNELLRRRNPGATTNP